MKLPIAALLVALVCSSCSGGPSPSLTQPSEPAEPLHPGLVQPKTWQEVLADLPFEVTSWGHSDSARTVPSLGGAGSMTPTELAAAFQKAGIPAQPDQFQVDGPPNLPVPTDTYPVAFTLFAPASAKSGTQLELVLRVSNLSSGDIELNYGVPSFLPVLMDRAGNPVRWRGGPWPMPLHILQVPAGKTHDISLSLPLNRFNPRLPLEPGEYTVKVAVQDVDVILSSRKKVNTTVTSAVLNVTD